MPSAVWLFSSKAATIRGNAKADPFKLWANSVLPSELR